MKEISALCLKSFRCRNRSHVGESGATSYPRQVPEMLRQISKTIHKFKLAAMHPTHEKNARWGSEGIGRKAPQRIKFERRLHIICSACSSTCFSSVLLICFCVCFSACFSFFSVCCSVFLVLLCSLLRLLRSCSLIFCRLLPRLENWGGLHKWERSLQKKQKSRTLCETSSREKAPSPNVIVLLTFQIEVLFFGYMTSTEMLDPCGQRAQNKPATRGIFSGSSRVT